MTPEQAYFRLLTVQRLLCHFPTRDDLLREEAHLREAAGPVLEEIARKTADADQAAN
jgi:hypothetical protein